MLNIILYYFLLFLELFIAMAVCTYVITMFFSSLMGAPYVATRKKEILFFLKEAGLKKGKQFLEIGCGDGVVVRTAVKQYRVVGKGIDINPVLIFICRILSKLQHIKNIEFKVENVFKTDFSKADYIYIFLMPAMIKKVIPFIKKQAKKDTIIICHGFTAPGLEKNLFKKLEREPFPTYFYRVGKGSLTRK